MATKKKNYDDDSATNFFYCIGAAKKMGDTRMLEKLKKANPEAYAAFEASERKKPAPKKK